MAVAEKPTRKTRVHTRYYSQDGTRLPGCTTITGVLNKPALVKWANNLGLNGVDVTKYVDDKAEIGTCAHYLIESHVKGEDPDLSDYSQNVIDKAENGYLKFLEWLPADFELLGSELTLVSEQYRYGGTCDIYALVNGKRALVDIKTSGSGIYPDMKHQVAGGYRQLLVENGYPVEEVWILRVGRDEREGFDAVRVDNWREHWEVFRFCRELYDALKVAK